MNAEQQGKQQQHPEVSFTAEENENEPMLDNDGNNNPSSNNTNDDDVDADMNNNNNHHEGDDEQQPADNEPDWNEIQLHEPAQTEVSLLLCTMVTNPPFDLGILFLL